MRSKFPKNEAALPSAKKDEVGNIVTKHGELKRLYLKTFTNRLRNRPMKSDMSEIRDMKIQLFDLRLELATKRKSKPWSLANLESVLKGLKKEKARDPSNWCNELFMSDVAGMSLKLSLLHILNRMKDENCFPDFARLADVTTIYKGKGAKCDLENDRGIFVVSVIRSILMKLIYKDYYSILDSSMSDSQIGGRKNKNIRNHVWILNAIIVDVVSSKSKTSVDVCIYDYKQCFDSLWLEECMNDVYSGGLQDDKFSLLYNVNKTVNLAVKTPVGKTSYRTINNVITQGDIFGPMFCSKQVDTFGKECLQEQKYTYLYRGEVEIPPLSMVDDLLFVAECGFKTAMSHGFITSKTDSKKLQFGGKKCKKLHVGKNHENFKCTDLSVDKWEEISIGGEIVDTCEEKEMIKSVTEEKYLGDVVSRDGRNIKNIKARVAKGKGIVSRILNVLEGIPLGPYYFEIAMMLRTSLLVSSMLCNSEAWYNLTKAELNLLESIDIQFLKVVLKAPKSTPTESLYLELGIVPFRNIIQQRRILFLHYILNQSSDSLIFKCFESQQKSTNKKDWSKQIVRDIDELKLNLSLSEVKEMTNLEIKNVLKIAVKRKAFEELLKRKESHSKMINLEYKSLNMQNYLKSSNENLTQRDAQDIFLLRTRMFDVKSNYKNKYEVLLCEACEENEETQEHFYKCEALESKWKVEFKEIWKNKVENQIQIMKICRENQLKRNQRKERKIAKLRKSCDSFCVHKMHETTFVCLFAIDNFCLHYYN